MAYEPQLADNRSVGELLSDLMHETTKLISQEITLAKNEMTAKAAVAGKNVGALAVGGAVAYAGVLVVLAAVVLILVRLGVPSWAAALLVGLIVTGAGGAMVKKGLDALKQIDPVPRQTVSTFKEDKKWTTERTG